MLSMRGFVCAALLLATPSGGLRVASPGDGSKEAPVSGPSSPFGEKGLLVVVLLTGGKATVDQDNFQNGQFQKTLNVGEVDNLELFDNWMQFYPKAMRAKLRVLCADSACVDHMEKKYRGPVHVIYKSIQEDIQHTNKVPSKVPTTEDLLKHRLKNVEFLLGKSYSVLVSDIDAIWLQNPIPYLEQTKGDVVALRDRDGANAMSSGFMLFRPSSRAALKDKLQSFGAYKSDEKAIRAAFLDRTGTQWTEHEDGTSVVANENYKTEAMLLPRHQFTLGRHLDLPDCKPNKMMHRDYADGPMCIDKKVLVAHNLGEVYRAKTATPHGKLWRLP